MAVIFLGTSARRRALLVAISVCAAPWACGGDDSAAPGGKPGGDASTDRSGNAGSGATGGARADGALDSANGGSAGTGASGTAGTSAGDGATVIDAEDAAYTLELGGQVAAQLGRVSPSDPSVSWAVVTGPTQGELLHLDPASGRFVYTSMVEGADSFVFAIKQGGQDVDTATVTLTTNPLNFVGDWQLSPRATGTGCNPYAFTVSEVDAGDLRIAPLISRCLVTAAGMSIAGGGTSVYTREPQALGVRFCVTDIRDVNYCYAFRYWRITSRDDFQSIETVSGTRNLGGMPYLISGSVRGGVRRAGDTGMRAAVAGRDTPNVIVGLSDGTPKQQALTLENKGGAVASIGKFTLPPQVNIEGGYPGPGGTCGATLDPARTCTVILTITPTAPSVGDSESVPLSVYFSDASGYDVTRLRVTWTWRMPPDAGPADAAVDAARD